ncbi:MAG: prenyltransferase/squalene oxidase repeat-containing protein [Planctomycetota bacterium]
MCLASYRVLVAVGMVTVGGLLASAVAADRERADASESGAVAQAVERGIEFLRSKGQAQDGSFSGQTGIGVTALVATAILRHGRTADDPLVAKSLEYLKGFVQPDGGIYVTDTFHKNYETCLALVAFQAANGDGRYNDLIKSAEKFIKGAQWDEGEGIDKSHFNYGGAGYGRNKRPDLSNTTFLLDALQAVGSGPDDPNVQNALIFVSRCQNLESEKNATPFAQQGPNDGGFYYTPAAGGVSFAGEAEGGGLRSYGSMTYAGLKSMIYAGLGPDDKRVKAALDWIRKHYGLNENPNMGQQGLYYYYHTFAKALAATKLETLEDDQGNKHDWRADLRKELISRQREDGSWLNDETRWMEGDPNLVTGYALLSLANCK